MNLIPNAGSTLVKSAAVWAAAIVSIITFTVNALAGPNAPLWITSHLPVVDIKATWDWALPVLSFAAVAIARVVQQDSISNS